MDTPIYFHVTQGIPRRSVCLLLASAGSNKQEPGVRDRSTLAVAPLNSNREGR